MGNVGWRRKSMKVSVTKSNDEWRTAPWVVRYYVHRKAVRRFFETKEEAEQHAREVRQTLRAGTDPDEFGEANRLIAGTGLKLSGLVKAGLQFMRESDAASVSPTATFSDGVRLVMENAKHRRAKTLVGYRSIFGRLEKVFGDRVATSITNSEVQGYLDQLCDRRGNHGRANPHTKETVLRNIRMVMRALGMAKPLPRLTVHVPPVREILFFTVDELQAILGAAQARDRGLVALATFAAIRPETLERLPADCVNPADKLIRIPAELSKDHRAHCLETIPLGTDREVRPGPPEVLWEWLREYPFQPRRWRSIQTYLRVELGRWIHDGLRHSGATYYRAKYGDAATAELLTHASITMVNQHYAGLTTRAEAERFFALSPRVVGPPRAYRTLQAKRVQYPSDAALADMLVSTPASRIAAHIGCSDSMLSKHCKKRGISKPGRGAWSTRSTS